MFNSCIKKRILAVLMAVIVILPSISVASSAVNLSAFEERNTVIDGVKITYMIIPKGKRYLNHEYESDAVMIAYFSSTSDFDGNLEIPSEIDGYPVKVILGYNYNHYAGNKMKSNTYDGTYHIEIPDCVDYIENYAFSKFEYLESIKMPVSDEHTFSYGGDYVVPDYVCYGCKNLKSVTLTNPKQKEYYIERECFSGCSNLTSINFPEGLQKIAEGAFSNTDLRSIDLPDSLKKIDIRAFGGNINLSTINNFSDRISVHYDVFSSSQAVFSFDGEQKYLGTTFIKCQRPFPYTPSDEKEIFIKDGTTRIAISSFYNLRDLKKLTLHIPSSMKYIPERTGTSASEIEELHIIYNGTKKMWDSIAPAYAFKAKTVKYTFLGLGDLDGDGEVTAADALLMRNYLARKLSDEDINTSAADVNGDGKINAKDQLMIRRALMA